ncbi:DUF6415 family natural product biosynthesis protein [Streptomyces sp. Edi2]|uniref:DUF6415 family natural product biosynthesis protein n=1 Tax=Streptomyces sp. Edi2 TaxID=3162528 RepID=UPI0033059598
MIRTVLSPRRVRRAVVAPCLWWGPRTAGKRLPLEASSFAVSAERDVHLVLGDDALLPVGQTDVDQLLVRFSSHLQDLVRAIGTDSQTSAGLGRARQLARPPWPPGYMESRIHLVMAAESVQELLAHVRADSAEPRRLRSRALSVHPIPLPPADARWASHREETHV